MGMFTNHLLTVYKNELTHNLKKQVVSEYVLVVSDIPCRVTGTHNDNIILFVLNKYYKKIIGGLHQGYKLEVNNGDFIQNYKIVKEPIWAGGLKHHIEAILEEFN